jgi:ParB/RepB/Spo0J family partition protein
MKTETTTPDTDTSNATTEDTLVGLRVRIDPDYGDDGSGNGPDTAWAGLYGQVQSVNPFGGYMVKVGRKTHSFLRMEFDPVAEGATPPNRTAPTVTVVNPLPPPSDATTTLRMADPMLAINSLTNPRRRHGLDIDSLNAMAASIKDHGLMQPIVVRPLPAARLAETSHLKPRPIYELVSGERRWRGAQIAELQTMPMLERDLTDEAVIELQLVENIEREDLDPMEEAEGFELLRAQLGYTVDQIADRIGRGRGVSYVRKAMKLLNLSPESREAMYAGHLGRSTGLLVARYPAERQAAVVDFIKSKAIKTKGGTEPAPFREIAPALHRFNTELKDAAFDTQDADLVPAAGACSTCPKRTGAAQDLFGDADQMGPDNCTDADCFQEKKEAHVVQIHARAKAQGLKVVDDADARNAKPSPYGTTIQGYVRLNDIAYVEQGDDEKQRGVTFEDALRSQGKKAPKPLVFIDPHTGKDTQVIPVDLADKLTPEEGETTKPRHITKAVRQAALVAAVDTYPPEVKALRDKQVARAAMLRMFDVMRNRQRTTEELRLVAIGMFQYGESPEELVEHLGWAQDLDALTYDAKETYILEKIEAMDSDQLAALIVMYAANDCINAAYSEPQRALELLGIYGIDVLAVQEKVQDDLAKQGAKEKGGTQ